MEGSGDRGTEIGMEKGVEIVAWRSEYRRELISRHGDRGGEGGGDRGTEIGVEKGVEIVARRSGWGREWRSWHGDRGGGRSGDRGTEIGVGKGVEIVARRSGWVREWRSRRRQTLCQFSVDNTQTSTLRSHTTNASTSVHLPWTLSRE